MIVRQISIDKLAEEPKRLNPNNKNHTKIDKNPNDTIPIKYTTVADVKKTIKKLERLYKKGAYSHKRIWQVGMIMKVRLEAMLKHKKKLYPNAKKVRETTKATLESVKSHVGLKTN